MLHQVSMHEGKRPIMKQRVHVRPTFPVSTFIERLDLKGALDAKDF